MHDIVDDIELDFGDIVWRGGPGGNPPIDIELKSVILEREHVKWDANLCCWDNLSQNPQLSDFVAELCLFKMSNYKQDAGKWVGGVVNRSIKRGDISCDFYNVIHPRGNILGYDWHMFPDEEIAIFLIGKVDGKWVRTSIKKAIYPKPPNPYERMPNGVPPKKIE